MSDDNEVTFTVVDPDEMLDRLVEAAVAGETDVFDEVAAELSAWLNQGGSPPVPPAGAGLVLDEVAAAIRAQQWAAPTVERIADIVARSGRAVPAPLIDKAER